MNRREPNFENLLKVLHNGVPERPVLFELFMNMPLYELAAGRKVDSSDRLSGARITVEAFTKLGYDYAVLSGGFHFPNHKYDRRKLTISLNDSVLISDEESFEKYPWPDPTDADCSVLYDIKPYLPEGMKLSVAGPGGVIENVISLVGYDNLCYMVKDEPELAQRIFDGVGSRMVRYYERLAQIDTIGLLCSSDDWGFNTQTFLSPADMRKYVFPWHRKLVEVAHAAGKPIFLHSCGNMREVIGDIVDMGFDAKHSFEDNILPIEQAYEAWHPQIALLGGLDMNFVCTQSPEEVARRTRAMLERTQTRGGWAVGTGNSIPEYVPLPQYMAMIEAAIGYNPLG